MAAVVRAEDAVRTELCRDAAAPLTVIEFGDGALAASLQGTHHLQEVVVVGAHHAAAAGPRPAIASYWSNGCKQPGQLFALHRALLREKRARVTVVGADVCPLQQMRLVQFFIGLPACSMLVLNAEPPQPSHRAFHKAVCVCSAASPTLACSELPRCPASRRQRWHAFLVAALEAAGAAVQRPCAAADGCSLLIARRKLAHGGAQAWEAAERAAHADRTMLARLFPPVILDPVGQLCALRREIEASAVRLAAVTLTRCEPETETGLTEGSSSTLAAALTMGEVELPSSIDISGQSIGISEQPAAAAAPGTTQQATAVAVATTAAPAKGLRARLVASNASRYTDGGYAAHHYVPQPPSPHATAFELELEPSASPASGASEAFAVNASSAAPPSADAPHGPSQRIGYISILAYGVESPLGLFPTAVPATRSLHAAHIERLVVLPPYRGSGAKEALLGACALYAERGYPVRVKTAAEHVHRTFLRCDLLAYEGHRPPGQMRCGVRRPMKRYARVLDPEIPLSAAPLSATSLSAAPLSATSLSAAPLSATSLSAAPLSAAPLSAAPVAAPTRTTKVGAGSEDHRQYDRCWRGGGHSGAVQSDAPSADLPVASYAWGGSACAYAHGESDAAPAADAADSAASVTDAIAATPSNNQLTGIAPAIAPAAAPVAAPAAVPAPTPAAVAAVPRALLNKLSTNNFERLAPRIAEAAFASQPVLRSTLALLFSRAAREPLFCGLYANAAAQLATYAAPAMGTVATATAATATAATAAAASADDAAPSREVAASFSAAALAELQRLLARGVAGDSTGAGPDALHAPTAGAGQLAAELVARGLVRPDQVLGAVLASPTSCLCAFTARAGARLSRHHVELLAALVARVRAESSGALGRGRPNGGADALACAAVLEQQRCGWPANESPTAPPTLTQVRQEAADEMGLVLVERGAPPEAMRGLRGGWVHWFVGAPTVHPHTGEAFTFDERTGAWRGVVVPTRRPDRL